MIVDVLKIQALQTLDTNTCEPLDVGKEDWDFLVAVDVDLVELGGDKLAWKRESMHLRSKS